MKKRVIETIWCVLALICLTLTTSDPVGWWNILGVAGFIIIVLTVTERYKEDIQQQTDSE